MLVLESEQTPLHFPTLGLFCRYVIALKVPKFSSYKPGIYYDTAEPQHTAMLTPGKQSSLNGYHDLLLVAGEAHDQVGAKLFQAELRSLDNLFKRT